MLNQGYSPYWQSQAFGNQRGDNDLFQLQLPPMDYFVEIVRSMRQKTEEKAAVVKVDHENAYEQL